MRKLIFLLALFLAFGISAQEEKFVYCTYSHFPTSYGSVSIEKINEQQSGDTIIKTFKRLGSEITFNYYIFNDSIFSKHEDRYYLIGANHAQIGDIWQPLWYDYFQYDKNISTFGNTCAFQRNLKVIGIEQITVGSEFRLKYKLKNLDSLPYSYEPFYFYFIEGIGATTGGLYYNLNWQGMCKPVTDMPDATFKYYETSEYQYLESDCKTTAVNDMDELMSVTFKKEDNYLYVQGVENKKFEISFIDLTGKVVLQVKNQQTIDVSTLKGLLMIQLNTEKGDKVVKLNFM